MAIERWGRRRLAAQLGQDKGKDKEDDTPWKPNRWVTTRGLGAHHDHGIGVKNGATL
jgi:hypothetical protein